MKARKKKSHETVWFHGSPITSPYVLIEAIRIFPNNCLCGCLHFVKALRET